MGNQVALLGFGQLVGFITGHGVFLRAYRLNLLTGGNTKPMRVILLINELPFRIG